MNLMVWFRQVERLLLLASISLLFGCSAAHQAVKRGNELAEMKNYYAATQEYLTALRLEPKRKDAKMKLCQFSKQGYDQKLALAEGLEKSSNHESALSHYNDLHDFLESVNSYNCLTFPPIDVKGKIAEMKSASSEKYYKDAEKLFASDDYQNAISAYREALKFNSAYKDCIEKIAESYYRMGSKDESLSRYREAAKNFATAAQTVKGYKDASKRSASLYYSLGDYFLSKGLYRNAVIDFNEVPKLIPGYLDINNKLSKAEASAVTKIAFVRFDNPTGKNIAGASVGDMIFDEVKSRLKRKSSPFIRVMEREEMNSILKEQELGMTGITDEYSSFKQLKGVDYLVLGKLSQVYFNKPGQRKESKQVRGTEYYDCRKKDKKGKEYDSTCDRDIDISYTEISDSISVTLTGSMKVLSVSTGEQVVSHNISSKESDTVNYAANFSKDISSSSIYVDKKIRESAKARKELKDEDDFMRSIVSRISDEMADNILGRIDATPSVDDPVAMRIYR